MSLFVVIGGSRQEPVGFLDIDFTVRAGERGPREVKAAHVAAAVITDDDLPFLAGVRPFGNGRQSGEP